MAYIPLHHKYRPQTFADLVGQEAIATTLTNALRLEKIAPAYLFTGPRGTGKTSSARILAKSLNCMASQVPTAQPCGKCAVCSSIASGAALDIIEIDAASNTGVDNIRELIERAQYAPVQCRYKVYIIDECLTGDSLILTDRGWMQIDDRTLVDRQVLSYNERQSQWEWKRVLRWLERGEKETLTINTTHREISCTGNHLIGTDRGWIKAQELKPGMKIRSPISQSSSKPNNSGQAVIADAAQNYLSPPTYNRGSLFTASNPIGKNIFTSKGMGSGSDVKPNLSPIPQLYPLNNSDSSTAPYWGTVPSPTPTNIVNYPDWLGLTVSVNKIGWHTKPVDSQSYDPNYKLLPTKDTVINPVPAKQPAIHNCQKSLPLSNRQEKARPSTLNGCDTSISKDSLGGISTMVPSVSALKEAPPSICTQKDTLLLKTNLLLAGLQSLAIQPMLNLTRKENNCGSITTSALMLAPVANGWKTYSAIPSPQWHTSLETIESVNLAGREKVYDLEVEDNHNFVANGLLVHNCHMLTTSAFNSLLKTLEEPPDRVVFVLATTDPQRVLPTIISRCQRFDYRRIPVAAMVSHLTEIAKIEQIEIAPASVQLVAQIAQGGLRDAESLLDRLSLLEGEITLDRVYDAIGSVPERDLVDILQAIATTDPEGLLDRTRAILERGKEPLTVLQNLAGCYRDLTIAKTAPKRPDLVALSAQTWTELVKIAQGWELSQILAGQQHLKDSEIQLKHTTQPQLWLEIAVLGLINVNTPQSQPVAQPNPTTRATTAPSPPPTTAPQHPPQIQSPSAIASSPPPAAIYTPPAAIDTEDLASDWERVLQQLLPASRDLFRPFGKLISLSDVQAIVAMKSSTMQTIAAGKVPELAKVFSSIYGRSIAVKLEVVGKIQPQSTLTPQAPPPAAPPPVRELSPVESAPPLPLAAPPIPAAGEYLDDSESDIDIEEDPIDLPAAISVPPPLVTKLAPLDIPPDPAPVELVIPTETLAEILPSELEAALAEPPVDFAEPPESVDIDRAATNPVESEAPEDIDDLLQTATERIVNMFNGEVIDRHHELFEQIIN
jgi:DNA polymerase III subunit gamma/tau